MNKNILRKIIRNLSFTSAVFVFQACYGTAQDFGMDLLVEGYVKSQSSGNGISGIKVSMNNGEFYDYTNDKGEFLFYVVPSDSLKFTFQDIDSTENSMYASKDTLITDFDDKVFLEIELEEM